MYYDANITFRILMKTIQGCEARTPELGIFPGVRAQKLKFQESELSLKFRTGAGAMVIWKVVPSPDPFLDTNGFSK